MRTLSVFFYCFISQGGFPYWRSGGFCIEESIEFHLHHHKKWDGNCKCGFYQYLTKGFHGSNFCDTGYRWSQNLIFLFVKWKCAKNVDQYCLQKLPFFGEESYDAWEREGAGGREARVQLKESSCWGGRGILRPRNSCEDGKTLDSAVRMGKHKIQL